MQLGCDMFIREIKAKNFRNYKGLTLELSPGINIITGRNAVGKTNLLEAISITSNTRSFRGIPDSDIIRWGEDSYYCCSTLEDSDSSTFEIGCTSISNRIKKKAKIDKEEINRMSDYYGRFLTVIFSPSDIEIITGSPEHRRRYFDGIISKVNKAYLNNLNEIKKITASRNRVLRGLNESKITSLNELDVWDAIFAEKASLILKTRAAFVDKFVNFFCNAYRIMSNSEDFPEIQYYSTIPSTDTDVIIEGLKRQRKKDIFFCSTTSGPHRDDYKLINRNGVAFKNCASQGEKRTASISMKIAECKFIENEKEKNPVILIDDIFAELDDNRRGNILKIISDNDQVIITLVNNDIIKTDEFGDYEKYLIESEGIIKKI